MQPDPSITVTVDGEEREIFMSYGLLNLLLKKVGDTTNIGMISLSPELRDIVLTETLAKRTKTGKLIGPLQPLDEVAISLDDITNLLDWVGQNLLDFTMAALTKAAAMKGRSKEKLLSLVDSLIGQAASPSTKPAA